MSNQEAQTNTKPTCMAWIAKSGSKLVFALIMVAAGAIGMFIFLNLSVFLLPGNFLYNLTGANAVLTSGSNHHVLTPEEKRSLLLLVDNGRVLTQDQFLSTLSQFYNNIINTLIVVISLLGVLAYFSIRAISREKAEEIAEKEVKREVKFKLEDSDYVNNLFSKNDVLKDLISETEERNELFEKLKNDIDNFEDRLISLENWLMQSESMNREKNEKVKIVPKGEE